MTSCGGVTPPSRIELPGRSAHAAACAPIKRRRDGGLQRLEIAASNGDIRPLRAHRCVRGDRAHRRGDASAKAEMAVGMAPRIELLDSSADAAGGVQIGRRRDGGWRGVTLLPRAELPGSPTHGTGGKAPPEAGLLHHWPAQDSSLLTNALVCGHSWPLLWLPWPGLDRVG